LLILLYTIIGSEGVYSCKTEDNRGTIIVLDSGSKFKPRIRLKLGDNSNLEDLGSTIEPITWHKIEEDLSSKVGL